MSTPHSSPNDLAAAWAAYCAAVTEAHPDYPSYLNGPLTDQELDKAQATLGVSFPEDLIALLHLNNGCDGTFVLPGWELFSAERIAQEWNIWAELYHDQFQPEGYDCEATPPIKTDEWWRLKWIPFCGDGGGNHLCVDLDPLPEGRVGQVITMWHDAPERDLIAASLTDFLKIITQDFRDGRLVWNEDWGGVYEPFEHSSEPEAPGTLWGKLTGWFSREKENK